MGKRKWRGLVFSVLGLAGLFFGSQLLDMDRVQACDTCNTALLKKTLEEQLDSPRAKHILTAAKNQKGLDFEGVSAVQAESEAIMEPYLLAQLESEAAAKEAEPVGETAVETVEEEKQAPNKPAVPPTAGGFDLNKILQRDARLPIPATSFVEQDVKADKVLEITLSEGKTYIGNGVVYDGFLINGSIPGPTLRVNEGDVVEFRVTNGGTIPHGASVHSVYSQSSKFLGNIAPGETKSLKFKATIPGVYLYHCAPGGHAIPMHVLAGQYGTIIVEPKKKYKLEQMLGHEPDLELFLTQHELYASGKDAIEGKAAYTMFNGQLFRYVEAPLVVRPGAYVRINFLNVGPNLLSTFHIVGILWDFAYWQGHPDMVYENGQTVTAGPSDSWVIEFRVPPAEGSYTMLSHAVGSTSRGAIGLIVADKNAPAKRAEPIVLADGPVYSETEMEALIKDSVRTISPFKPGSRELARPVVHDDPNKEAIVYIKGNSFNSSVIEVPVGTTVTWINEDAFTYLAGELSGVHNVVVTEGPESFMSPMLGHGESFSHTFTEVGVYDYMCAPHPYMRGRVIVTEAKRAGVGAGVPNWWWVIVALLILGNVGALAVAMNRRR